MKLILLVLTFFVLGALFIISNQNLALHDSEDFRVFRQEYYTWVSHLFNNGQGILGYVVKSEWLPGNEPLFEK